VKLFVDLDGVLVDLERGFREKTGLNIQDHDHDFFQYIDGDREFWFDLAWMPHGRALWEHLEPLRPTILSAPTRDPASRLGKIDWVNRHLGRDIPIILTADKYRHAGPGHILIDDREINTVPWEVHGGEAILHRDNGTTLRRLKFLTNKGAA